MRDRLTALGLGTAALAVPYGAPGGEREAPPREAAEEAIELALGRGIGFIDTAPAYGDAEAIVGEAAGDSGCVIATKLAIPAGGWAALDGRETEAAARNSVEASLRALRRDRIDMLQIHNADAEILARGVLPAVLDALRAEGVVSAVGGTVYGEDNALAVIGAPGFDAVQVAYSALDRRAERSVIPAAAETGTAVIARSSLLRGVLSPAGRALGGPFAPLTGAADRFRAAIGATWEELPGAAVAYSMTRPGIASTVLGPRDAAELRDLLEGAERFAGAARSLDHEPAALPAELLDPSRWPELEAAAR